MTEKEKARARWHRWIAKPANRVRHLLTTKLWAVRNHAKRKEYDKRRRAALRESLLAQHREWYQRNLAKKRAQSREHYLKHREEILSRKMRRRNVLRTQRRITMFNAMEAQTCATERAREVEEQAALRRRMAELEARQLEQSLCAS